MSSGFLGFNGPLRQYFSLYRASSQRGRKKKDKRESKNVQTTPACTYCERNRPLLSLFPNWKDRRKRKKSPPAPTASTAVSYYKPVLPRRPDTKKLHIFHDPTISPHNPNMTLIFLGGGRHILSFLLTLIQWGQLSVTGGSMGTKYWLTA